MTDSNSPDGARTYRQWTGLFASAVGALLTLYLLGDAVVRGSWAQMLLLAPWVLLGLWVVYVLSAASRLRVDASGVFAQNLLRTVSFGWARVRDVDFRWQLEFALEDDTTVTAMGGPAHSRARRQTSREREVEGAKVPAGVRALSEITDLRKAAVAADAPIRRSWDWISLGVLAVLVVWAVVAVLITR